MPRIAADGGPARAGNAVAAPRTPAPTGAGPALGPGDRGSPVETAPAQAERCEWCGEPLGPGAKRLAGRPRCRRCGAATSDPVSDAELDRAYDGWYRPDDGRFAGPGD